jgi:predicted RNA-binding protein with PUA-like domain
MQSITVSYASGHAGFVEIDSIGHHHNSPILKERSVNPYSNKLTVDVFMRNFNASDKAKVNAAKEALEKIMNSEEFKQKVIHFTWNGVRQYNDNNGMTNEQIYDHLMTGSEILMPDTVGVMNFDLTLYRSKNPWSKVKGYTTADSMRIYMNTKFFRQSSWTAADVAGNMAHEWVHKMGFGHDYRHNEERPYSVPYAIGYIVGEMARSMGY